MRTEILLLLVARANQYTVFGRCTLGICLERAVHNEVCVSQNDACLEMS